MARDTRVLIADDHSIFRRGLQLVIEAQQGLTIAARVSVDLPRQIRRSTDP
jgi:DNA-binding NarL/FixJ family response regulator